ncbi:MAG: hypothetical protein ACI36Z_03085 [Alloprevotella sp.]
MYILSIPNTKKTHMRQMFRSIGVILLFLFPLVSSAVNRWSDKGCYDITWYSASKKIFEINNEKQLAGVAYLVNNGYTTFSGKTIKMAEDIMLSNRHWVPIGQKGLPFCGTFDGNGKEVEDLSIVQSSVESPYVYYGLFGYIQNATIKNLTVSGIIDFKIDNYFPEQYIGSIAAYAEYSTMKNCLSKVKINYDRTHAYNAKYNIYIGGMLGGSNRNSFESCNFTSDISAGIYRGTIVDSESYTGGNFYVGGLCANDYGSVFKYCSAVISDFDIHMTGSRNENMAVVIAGLVGDAGSSDIYSCYSIVDNIKYMYYTDKIVSLRFAGITISHSTSNGQRGIHNCYSIVNKMKLGTGTVNSNVSVGSIYVYGEKNHPKCYTGNYGNSDIVIDCASLPCYRGYDGLTTFTAQEMRTQDFVDELNLYFIINGNIGLWKLGEEGYPKIAIEEAMGVKESIKAKKVIKEEFISMNGVIKTEPSNGVYIHKKTFDDGTFSHEKMFVN